MKPEFIDNLDGNTLLSALRGHLAWARETYREPLSLSVATGYFNPEGFSLIADSLGNLRSVRLLLGAEPYYPPAMIPRRLDEPRDEWRREEIRLRGALASAEEGIRRDRDLLTFDPRTDRAVRRLLDFLATGRLEVRRYEKGFLHGKAFVFSNQDGAIAGSSNFTAAGLTRNLELNLGHYSPSVVGQVQGWFDRLWEEAPPFDLAAVYAERFEEIAPYLVYLRILWERYHQEIEQERETDPNRRIRLTTFQTDGVFRAGRILDRYHGVVVADGVGLGKTFVAGEVIRRVKETRRRVLLVAPAALRDGTWRAFLDHHDLKVDCVSYEQLAGWPGTPGTAIPGFHTPVEEYSLVVVDEAHAFRNPETDRADRLRRLLQGSPQKDLMLLSATPVNNSLWDLYYLLTYFAGHDAVFADRGIPSLKDRFQQASALDPESLKPEVLFDVLDAVAVRRTRHFVKRYYPNDRVIGPGGVEIQVKFPEPEVKAVEYRFDEVLPGFFAEFARALMPEDDEPLLTMARFAPSRFRQRRDPDQERKEGALVGLLRSALLKRFESSVHAFARTADRMVRAHDLFLDALDRGYVATGEALADMAEAMDTGSEDALEELLQEAGSEPAANFDVPRLRAAVQADRDLLAAFGGRAAAVRLEDDPKLHALTEALADLLRQADRDGKDPDQVRDCRKVLVFSYYAETVDWIVRHLERVLAADRRFAAYRGRLASVSGQESRGGVSRRDAVFGFTPRSAEAPPGSDADRFDVLVATDVLAEGLNLQQARNIVNFDLPWNPMRLVQRHGRIDRIGSPHERVFIRCFFPDARLDELLVLEERIRRKLAQAAASIGVESEVIPGGATAEHVFSEPREEIERLRREEADLFVNGGEDEREHSGEEYRQELRKGIERFGEDAIRTLPWGAGSGFVGGAEKGHVFCARVGDRSFLRFIPASGAKPVRDTLSCLRLVTCREDTPRTLPKETQEAAYAAWERAREDIFEEWSFSTDPANLQPKVRPLFRRAADHLRKHSPEGVAQPDLDRVISALEAPWGVRIERQIRPVLDAPGEDSRAVSAALVARVHDLGLQPFEPPKPLPVIDEGDVVLICWMAVEPSPANRTTGPA